MKAYVLHGINDLIYEETTTPIPPKGWALVQVKAAGICGSDIPRIFDTGTYSFPTIPGHEFSGVVTAVGDEKDALFIGKRVGIFPLIPCRECFCCQNELYEMCRHYSYLGSRTDGGFAEYVIAPVWNLIELPESVTYEEAAMLEPSSVALHAIRQFTTIADKNILIFGAGPIGIILAQFARSMSAGKVMLVVNKEQQESKLKELGFEYICNSNKQDVIEWVNEQTDGKGADNVVEGVGQSSVLEQCLQAVKPKGEILVMGNPHDDLHLSKNVYWQLLRKQIRILGTWNSSYKSHNNDWLDVLKSLEQHQITLTPLITHKLPFDQLIKGLSIMRNKSEYYCKVMICNNK